MHHVITVARAFAVRTHFAYALALALVLSLFLLAGLPHSALANDESAESPYQVVIDKADFYSEAPFEGPDYSLCFLSSLMDVAPSEEMRYFAEYESHKAYDATLSAGDGYNAMGYYQFDRRYGLQNFIVQCYEYDPVTFVMFEPYAEIDPVTEKYVTSIMKMTIREKYTEIDENGKEVTKTRFTKEAEAVNAAWKAAYQADPVAFAALQDAWAYKQYYVPAETYLRSRGIEISDRADCVKGLCWGMVNLFGSGGWRKFVGGETSGYDWDGEWQDSYDWPGCGLTDDMTDTEFVTTLCNYVVENVAVFYKAQPEYHAGWRNRYKNELNICLEYLADDEPPIEDEPPFETPKVELAPDVKDTDWYVTNGSYAFVVSNGIMTGNDDGTFEPYGDITRAEVVTVLWRIAGKPTVSDGASFSDVKDGYFYSDAVAWAATAGITTGYDSGKYKGMFRPNAPVTREQLATFMYRFAQLLTPHHANFSNTALKKLPDAGKISSFATSGMGWCIDKGIMTGVDVKGTYYANPQDNAWRASMATMVQRLLTKLV